MHDIDKVHVLLPERHRAIDFPEVIVEMEVERSPWTIFYVDEQGKEFKEDKVCKALG